MASEISIKRLSKERIKDVQYIIKKVFKKNLTLAFLDHKFNTKQYCDFEYLCCLAYHNDKPIGFYGATPYIFSDLNEQKLLVQTHDTFVLKEFQGKGVHKKLAEASIELMKKAGAVAAFAFHSEATYHSYKKIGWLDGYELNRVHLYNDKKFPSFKLYSKYSFLNSIKTKKINNVLKDYNTINNFKNDYQEPKQHSVIYDQKYIDFKTKFNTKIIEINNCKIWVKFQSILTIGGFDGLNEKNFHLIMNELKTLAKKVGTNEVLIPYNPNASYAKLFLKNKIEVKKSFHLGYLPLSSNINFNDYLINYSEFDTFL